MYIVVVLLVLNLVWTEYDVFTYMFFFFKQKTAYEMRISDWSSDVCSSDLQRPLIFQDTFRAAYSSHRTGRHSEKAPCGAGQFSWKDHTFQPSDLVPLRSCALVRAKVSLL